MLQRYFMVNFFALFDNNALLQLFGSESEGGIGDFLPVHQDAALLHQLAGFTVGSAQFGCYHGEQQAHLAILEERRIQLGGGHVGFVGSAAEQARAVAWALAASSSPWTILVSS